MLQRTFFRSPVSGSELRGVVEGYKWGWCSGLVLASHVEGYCDGSHRQTKG